MKLRNLEKYKTRKSESCREKEKKFKETLHDLFDIAHFNASNIIKIQEDKDFLLMQRRPGRPGCMLRYVYI